MKSKAVLFLLLFLFSCSDNAQKTELDSLAEDNIPAYGDAYVVGSLSDASYLNPILANDTASGTAIAQLFNGMLKFDKNLNIVGDLAESYEVAKDGLSIVFKLRKDVLWHDGEPFTAKDVEFTYKILIDSNTRTSYSADFLIVKEFIVIDDYTVKVTYDTPFAPNLQNWMMSIIPEHIFRGLDINNAPANRNPIGTGPYKFVSWQTDQKIVLAANPYYHEGKPYIERYIIQVVPDSAVQFLELRNESLDLVGLTPDQWGAYDSFFKHYNKYREPSFAFTFFGMNMLRKPFDNVDFRRAIQYAINKNDIIDGVLLGTGKEAIGPYPPQSWAYNTNIPFAEYNPQKALEILKELGFEDINKDGYLEHNGKPFEFTITTNQGGKQRELAAQVIQEQLKKIGIKTSIRIIEFSTFINQYIAKRDFDALIMGWSLTLDPDQYALWHSKQTAPREYNFMSYNNPKIDELYENARRTFNQEERKKMYFEIQEIMYKDIPCIFLYYPEGMSALHKRFKGIEEAPAGIGHNFIRWWVPKSRIKYSFQD